jgi:hypothetical protein
MKKVVIIDELMKYLAYMLQNENELSKLQGKSEEYRAGYNAALEFVLERLRNI